MRTGEDDPRRNPPFDETGDESSPRPDANVTEEIGKEAGDPRGRSEPVEGTQQRVGERDRHRWELDPASAEDYESRRREEREGRAGPDPGERSEEPKTHEGPGGP
jgi:hypothetical protein